VTAPEAVRERGDRVPAGDHVLHGGRRPRRGSSLAAPPDPDRAARAGTPLPILELLKLAADFRV
jgi:hypothetical protein